MLRFLIICITLVLSIQCPNITLADVPKSHLLTGVEDIESRYKFISRTFHDPKSQLIHLAFGFSNSGHAFAPDGKEGIVKVLAVAVQDGLFASGISAEDFANFLEENNISLSAGADKDNFYIMLSSWSSNLEKIFKLLRNILNNEQINDASLLQAKEKVLSMIDALMEDPQFVGSRKLEQLIYGNHPYSKSSIGTKESINSISASDLLNQARKMFNRVNINISIAGNFDRGQLTQILDKYLSDLPLVSSTPELPILSLAESPLTEQGNKLIEVDMKIPNKLLLFAYNSLDPKDPDYPKSIIFNYLLGGGSGLNSLLAQELRIKKALTYGISTSISPSKRSTILAGISFTTTNDLTSFKTTVESVISKSKKEMISKTAFAKAQDALVDKYYLGLTTNSQISSRMMMLQLWGFDMEKFNNYAREIEAVTYEDFISFVKGPKSLHPGKGIFIIVRDGDINSTKN